MNQPIKILSLIVFLSIICFATVYAAPKQESTTTKKSAEPLSEAKKLELIRAGLMDKNGNWITPSTSTNTGLRQVPAPNINLPVPPGAACGDLPPGSRDHQICLCRGGQMPPSFRETCQQLLRYDQCVKNNAAERNVVGMCECSVGLRTEGCAEFYNP